MISYDYINYEKGLNHNFANHPIGRNEIEYNRSLNIVREDQRVEMENLYGNQDPNGSQLFKLGNSMRKTIVGHLS